MPKETFVVAIEGTSLYLTGYNISNPNDSLFGSLSQGVVEFSTLQAANKAAFDIGGGTVGTTKPNS